MNYPSDAEFDIRRVQSAPWDPGSESGAYNPKRGVSIRVGDTWVPGEDVYIDTFEIPFWIDVLKKLKKLHGESTKETVVFPDRQAFVFERIDNERVSVMNHYSERSIEDDSELLGIEKRGTCSLTTLSNAALENVQRILNSVRRAELTRSESNIMHRLEESAQKLTSEV